MITAALILLALAAALVFAALWYRARRESDDLRQAADRLVEQLAREQAKVRHLQKRNADLRDELDIAQGRESSLVAEWTAALADITPEDFR